MKTTSLHARRMTREDAESEDALEQQSNARYTTPAGEQHEKTDSEIHALQRLPKPVQVQGDGQVHDEGR